MAIARPLRWDTASSALKEMSDADLAQLAYYCRYNWANDLHGTYTTNCARDGSATASNGIGAVYRVGSGSATSSDYNHLGSFTDQRKTPQTLSQSDDAGYPPNDDDSFGTPSESSFNDTLSVRQTFYREEYLGTSALPSTPSTSTLNTNSYLYWDSSGYVKIEGATANIIDTIIKVCNYEILQGDKVGRLQIATSDPSEGTDHVWSDLGTFCEDTLSTYSFPTSISSTVASDYHLYIKRSAPFSGTTDNELTQFMQWNAGNSRIQQVDKGSSTSTFSTLATNVILPIWKNSSIYPRYKFAGSSSLAGAWEQAAGTIADTWYDTSQTTGPTLDGSTYYSARYGLATTSTSTYFILYCGSDATSYRS